jgi:hypothetical protein
MELAIVYLLVNLSLNNTSTWLAIPTCETSSHTLKEIREIREARMTSAFGGPAACLIGMWGTGNLCSLWLLLGSC